MRRKKSCLIIAVIVALNLCANSWLFAQSVILTDTEIKEDDHAVKMLFSTNRSISVECYDLSVPPQVIIDFMGEIYTNKPEIMMVNKGVVKQMRVIRGTKKSQDLEDSFYSVDFIIVDLKESMRYDFSQGLTTSVLVISKPDKVPSAKKTRKEVVKPVSIPVAPVVAKQESKVSVTKRTPISMEDKEYEMPVKTVKSEKAEEIKKTPRAKRVARTKKGRIKKVKKQKPMAAKSEAKATTTVGKMKQGIKNFFTFGKSKEKRVPKKKQVVKVEKPKPAVKKEATEKSKKRTFRSKRRTPKERTVVKKTKRSKRKPKPKKAKKGASSEDFHLNAIAYAKEVVEQKTTELDIANKNITFAGDNLKEADEARKTIGQRIKNNHTKQELLKDGYNESLKIATFAKNAANANWLQYSDAKAKLSLFLKNEVESENIEKVQKIYEQKRIAMSQAINTAESAKEESEAKLAVYEQVVQEGNDLLVEVEGHKKNVGREQMQYNVAEEAMHTKRQELSNAKKELQRAERAYQQYEMDKAEEEYKKSLFNIDETLALEAEKEQRRKEAERLSRIEEQKAEQRRMQQEIKDKEEAQLAALKQVQKNEEADKKQFLRRRNEKVEPKRRRVKPLAKPESRVEPVQRRAEVLQTAVELRNSGLEMQRVGDFDSAVKYYQQALISDPKYATVHNDLGILYEQKGLNDKAKMEYLSALKINPHYIRAHSNLALLYEKSGDNNKAYYHWKQRVQLGRPDDPWTQKAKQRMELLEQQRK